jgi:site-specific DNA-methyltransferase (adenine-specific)
MIKILHGSCLDRLKDLEDQSINTCITSPPYWGLRDYGEGKQLGLEETPEEFVNNLVEVFREVKRVLRDDGTVWLNLGDSYGQQKGKGFNANSKEGYVVSRRKELQERQGNIEVKTNLPPKNLVGIPWRVAFALQADGWYLRQDIIWHKPNPMPESVKDRCTKAHEYIFLLSKSRKYYCDMESIREPIKESNKGFIMARARTAQGALGGKNKHNMEKRNYKEIKGANKRSVWTVTTKPFKGAHFATFPMDLIEPCVLAGCPEGGTVLDPFGGSGTTALVANGHNRDAVLIEINEEYIEIAKKRLGVGTDLFNKIEIKDD